MEAWVILVPGAGGTPYMKGVGMLVGNFELKPLKETDMGVAQAFLTPKRDHIKTQTIYIFLFFSRATLNETFKAKYDGILPRTP